MQVSYANATYYPNKLYRAFYHEDGFTNGGGSLFDGLGNVLGDVKSSITERQNVRGLIFCVTHEPATLRRYLCAHGQHPRKPGDDTASTLLNKSPVKPGYENQTKIENQVGGNISLNANARLTTDKADLGDRNSSTHLDNNNKSSKTVAVRVEDARIVGGGALLQQLCARLSGDNCESIRSM